MVCYGISGVVNWGSVAGEFTDNFVHPSNQPLNKGRLGDMGGGGGTFLEKST